MLSQITTCKANNGRATFFWHDRWLLAEPLATIYPALYTHHLSPQARVADVLLAGIESNLRPRLTSNATAELSSLLVLLQDLQANDDADIRTMIDGTPFSSRAAYKQLHAHLANDAFMPIWQSKLPHRIRVFAWLLSLDRLNTREKLARKNIIDDNCCPLCTTSPEDRAHLFLNCPAARAVWNRIGIPTPSLDMHDVWTRSPHDLVPEESCTFAMTAIMWRIWDARNSVIFKQHALTCSMVITRITEDITLWSHRIKNLDHKARLLLWRDHLSSCILVT
jgi:hypothetical protein